MLTVVDFSLSWLAGMVMRNIIPVVMAGVLGIYGLIVSVVSVLHTTRYIQLCRT
jgi:hypothetical protein